MRRENKLKILVGAVVLGVLAVKVLQTKSTIPTGAQAVRPFEVDRYLGKWYEIARFDFYFEKDLNQVTATYTKNEDGTIAVLNQGFNTKKQQWQKAYGKAKFIDDPLEAKLKVSFFGPFYSGYNVVALDEDYKYAMIYGKNKDYLWLLSREKTMPEAVVQAYLQQASNLGYDISKLLYTEQ